MKSNLSKIVLSTLLCSSLYSFDFGAIASELLKPHTTKDTNVVQTTKNDLNNTKMVSALKETLNLGVKYAIEELGAKDGYLKNKDVKIPLPQNLSKMETLIRGAGGDKIANNLIESMNDAATEAAPKTASIFADAIKDMSIDDTKGILAGDKDGATKYFKTNTSTKLHELIKPIVQKSMQENSVASYYDTFNRYYKQYGESYIQNSSIMGIAKSYGLDNFIPTSSDANLDEYVTNKAIDGLFEMIAKKEVQIRENPIEQTTSLLKEVFGN